MGARYAKALTRGRQLCKQGSEGNGKAGKCAYDGRHWQTEKRPLPVVQSIPDD
jgi:hypothetical protein